MLGSKLFDIPSYVRIKHEVYNREKFHEWSVFTLIEWEILLMLHISKFFFPVIIIFFVRFCFLGSSENLNLEKTKKKIKKLKCLP